MKTLFSPMPVILRRKRDELKGIDIDWDIAERRGKVRTLKQPLRINKGLINIEYMKARYRGSQKMTAS